MNGFEKFIHALQFESTRPRLFGWYHLSAIAVVAALVTLVFVFRRKITRKFINVNMLTIGIVLIVSEIFKQLIHSLDVIDGVAAWDYSWRNFPFQFCSVPIYLMIIAGALRKGKAYETILTFLATFSLWAGIVVVIYPSTVLSAIVFFSLHTMLWHGSMVVVGFMLLATKTVQLRFKNVLKACIIFAIVVSIAQIMNLLWPLFKIDKTFNMFYISPHYTCDMPILDTIQEKAPYVVFLLCYILGFVGIAFLVMAIAKGIDKLYGIITRKKQSSEATARE